MRINFNSFIIRPSVEKYGKCEILWKNKSLGIILIHKREYLMGLGTDGKLLRNSVAVGLLFPCWNYNEISYPSYPVEHEILYFFSYFLYFSTFFSYVIHCN